MSKLWILIIACLALSGFSNPAFAAESQTGLVYQQIGLKKLRLDLFYPEAPAPAAGYPFVIWIHGGGWAIGNRSSDLFFKNFTGAGFAVASLDYRSSLHAKFPAQIEDVTTATEWLLSNSKKLQLNPQRMGAAGASAGGHLALLLGLSQNQKSAPWTLRVPAVQQIKAIAALYPPTDLIRVVAPERREKSNNLVALLLGAPVTEKRAEAIAGSPIHYVSAQSPPVFLVHGEKDDIVPFEQSTLLERALKAEGVSCRLVAYPNEAHGFKPNPKTLREIAEFFRKTLN